VARERESRKQTEESVRVDPICDVEFEGGMYRVVQLLDKVKQRDLWGAVGPGGGC
jgi:hypothetical protein